jgi:hypothetical protein
VIAGVVAVASEVGHVDAADEGQLSVDHDRLLVVAVERVLARITFTADLGLAGQRLQTRAHVLARWVKSGHRRSGPRQQTHVEPAAGARPRIACGPRLVIRRIKRS